MLRAVKTLRIMTVAVLATVTVGLLPAAPAAAEVPVLVLDGTGYGHGVGLSQWGARYLARTGQSTEQILGTFYPGAALGRAGGTVRVLVRRPGSATTTLSFPAGGELRSPVDGPQAPGFPVRVGPGGRVRVTFDGAYRVDPVVAAQARSVALYDDCWLGPVLCPLTTQPPPPSTTSTTGPPPPTPTTPPTSAPAPVAPTPRPAPAASPTPVWAVPAAGGVTTVDERGRSYRGLVEATGGGVLRLVNHVPVEDYVRGIREVPGTWPAAAVRAQVIAARTYGLRAMGASGEICDDARCQVYAGASSETAGQNEAVAATEGQVLTYRGALAAAVYSADAGGVSASTVEGFGTPDGVHPYLRVVRYETDDPLPWHAEVALDDVASRLGYPGTLTAVDVARTGPSDRALEVALAGTAGARRVDGRSFARALGLRSTRFTAALSTSATAPEPLAPHELQALPEATVDLPPVSSDRPGPMLERRPDRRPFAVPSPPPIGEAVDPRRHPAPYLAALALAGVVGGLLPLLLAQGARPGGPVRWLATWRRRPPPAA